VAASARTTDRLTSVEEARRLILGRAHWLGFESVPLSEALGRVLADDIQAGGPVPRFDNSSMDGFAVRADADAVVRLEDAARSADQLSVSKPVPVDHNVRHLGDDIAAGTQVLSAGTTVGPAELGVLASLGIDPVLCSSRPRVAIVVSGDELTAPGEPLGPGQIHDANAYTLQALATGAGAEVIVVEQVDDDPEETRAALGAALAAVDLLIVSGGISVGSLDHVKGPRGGRGNGLRPARQPGLGDGLLHPARAAGDPPDARRRCRPAAGVRPPRRRGRTRTGPPPRRPLRPRGA
jgi:molybdopterin biosynthesis enzyme